MSNLHRGHFIDVSYQVSVHLAKRFQRKDFFLEIDQSETRIAYGGHVCKWIKTSGRSPIKIAHFVIGNSGFRLVDF
jgi:hypothetical protein